jgi:hypothetical protein
LPAAGSMSLKRTGTRIKGRRSPYVPGSSPLLASLAPHAEGRFSPALLPHHRDALPLRLAIRGNAPRTMSMDAFSREGLLSLLESVESAISELQSRNEPRLEGVISRLERRRAEIVAALASKGRPEQ